MVKKLTKKLKDLELEITFAEPREYDIAKDTNTRKKENRKRKRSPPRKRTKFSRSKKGR